MHNNVVLRCHLESMWKLILFTYRVPWFIVLICQYTLFQKINQNILTGPTSETTFFDIPLIYYRPLFKIHLQYHFIWSYYGTKWVFIPWHSISTKSKETLEKWRCMFIDKRIRWHVVTSQITFYDSPRELPRLKEARPFPSSPRQSQNALLSGTLTSKRKDGDKNTRNVFSKHKGWQICIFNTKACICIRT